MNSVSLARLETIERQFLGTGDSEHNYGWSPLPLTIFCRMLKIARAAAPGNFFMEAGAGIGTKLHIAHESGLWEYGFEQNQNMIDFARLSFQVRIYPGDVTDMPYEMADIIYIARPFKHDDEEVAYEETVHKRIRNGAVLIAAYAAVKPPWHILHREAQHGVWKKPEDGRPVARAATPAVPRTLGEYRDMIRRTASGPDPLVNEPGPK